MRVIRISCRRRKKDKGALGTELLLRENLKLLANARSLVLFADG